VLDGALWIFETGARWKDLPLQYPPYQTCRRQFQQEARDGTLERVLRTLAEDLSERGGLDIRGASIDVTFRGAKKGGSGVGKSRRGKGSKLRAVADRHGLPVAARVTGASSHEVTLVEPTFDAAWVGKVPEKLIGDRACDRDPLDRRLAEERRVELIDPIGATANVRPRRTADRCDVMYGVGR